MPPLRQIPAVFVLSVSPVSQITVAAGCPYPDKVMFAELDWGSGVFTTDLLCYVLEKSYDYETDALPDNTTATGNTLRQNDIQVTEE